MIRRSLPLAAPTALALAVLVGACAALPARAVPPHHRRVAGTWKLAGWNLDAAPHGPPSYHGTVEVVAKGHNTFLVSWKIGGRVTNRGVGLYDPRTDVFAAGYSISHTPGVAVYRFTKGGRVMDCVGTFEGRIGEVAHERWSRR